MPQGCAKRIQIQLLLANFPLQLGNSALSGSRRIFRGRRHRHVPCGRREQRATNLLQSVRPVRKILPAHLYKRSRLTPSSAASAVTSSAASINDIARSLNSRVQRVFFCPFFCRPTPLFSFQNSVPLFRVSV
jgi:hypothetical protein